MKKNLEISHLRERTSSNSAQKIKLNLADINPRLLTFLRLVQLLILIIFCETKVDKGQLTPIALRAYWMEISV